MSETTANLLLLSMTIFLSPDSILIGSFLFLKPAAAIELQRKFYEKINWRMEPIIVEKEIKNTKIMGIFLFIVGVVTLVYLVVR